jgi:L-malate glycosyltransferase
MTIAIHQMLTTIVPGDAISHHTLAIREILRGQGFESEIFVETVHPDLVAITHPINEYQLFSRAGNILIFHFSQGTHLADLVLTLPERIVLIYHNITPEVYFRRVHHHAWLSLIQGRRQLPLLARKAAFGFADSEFNRRELEEAGCAHTGVLPIILDFESHRRPLNRIVSAMFPEKLTTFLFVGRVTPNKGHEHLLTFFYYYRKIDPSARLWIVGMYYGFEPYLYKLNRMVRHLRLEEVYFTGHVTHDELCTYYRMADLFLCFSLHEGFCVPLVESMWFDLPILALRRTAVGDTLGNAGLQFDSFEPTLMAETANRILTDANLRSRVLDRQRHRLQQFDPAVISRILLDSLQPLLVEQGGHT